MSNFRKFFIHLHIIHTHRRYVRKFAFKMGIGWRGLTHDLSKYFPDEFSTFKYATGKKSPHKSMREIYGCSPTHRLHKMRNKHHYEHWNVYTKAQVVHKKDWLKLKKEFNNEN